MKKGEYIYPSSNGFDFLESYLTQLYGTRGSAKHNLERYRDGDEFRAGCRYATDIEQIPEITGDDIKNIINRQEMFKALSRDIQKRYDELQSNSTLTDDDYYEIAGIMGICPGHTAWMDTLFPHVVDGFVTSQAEADKIFKDVKKKSNVLKIMVDMMVCYLREGQIIRFEDRDVLSQGYASFFYRGESAYNRTTKPSISRKCPDDPKEAEMHYLIAAMKMIEFCGWLTNLDCVKHWAYGDIYHGAIAQHYGIPTNAIDVTPNLKVALFFACCKYDSSEKKWKPLKKADFEFEDSRPRVFARGGDSRYGILFSEAADIAELSRVSPNAGIHFTKVEPIGYQPFLRCPYQSGYLIPAAFSYDMYKDVSFAKVKFRHTEELCSWIYNEMDQGKKIYPIEDMIGCEEVADKINHSDVFSEQSLDGAMQFLKIDVSRRNELTDKLKSKGIALKDTIEWLSKDKLERMNEAWMSGNYAEQMGITPTMKIGFSI